MSSSQRLHEWLFDRTGRTFSRVQKLMLLLGIAFSAGVAVLLGKLLHVPQIRGFSASMLQNSPRLAGILAVAVTIIAAAMLCTVLGRRIRPDAGIFCAAVGLLAFRLQGGAARQALLVADGRPALLTLTAELAILTGVLLIVFAAIRSFVLRGAIPDDTECDAAELKPEKFDQRILCTAAMTVVMIVGMLLLCRSDWPSQAMASVLITSLAAAWCAFRFVPTGPSVWYWISPCIVGLFGYLYAWQYGYADAVIGQPSGFFAALVRPVPLDYASLGVAGALAGYWIARRQLHERQTRDLDEGEAKVA